MFSDDVVDGLARIVGNEICFGKTYNLSGPEAITLRELGKLILRARRPLAPVPAPARCRFCRALAAVLGRVMKDPPLTPYAVAGFTNDADLDLRRRPCADFGYAPARCSRGLATVCAAIVCRHGPPPKRSPT